MSKSLLFNHQAATALYIDSLFENSCTRKGHTVASSQSWPHSKTWAVMRRQSPLLRTFFPFEPSTQINCYFTAQTNFASFTNNNKQRPFTIMWKLVFWDALCWISWSSLPSSDDNQGPAQNFNLVKQSPESTWSGAIGGFHVPYIGNESLTDMTRRAVDME